jgi:hypothetical protein
MGDTLDLWEVGEPSQHLGKAICLGTQLFNCTNIPESLLQYEHDATCTTMDGLTAAMDRAYGRGKWGPVVTVITFWVPPQDK